jgi:hypothetical protein
MIEALAIEATAIRKKGGGAQVELRGGERVGQAEGSWLYRFVVAEDLNLRDDTPVRVTAGQDDVPGVIASFRDGVLLVALERLAAARKTLAAREQARTQAQAAIGDGKSLARQRTTKGAGSQVPRSRRERPRLTIH